MLPRRRCSTSSRTRWLSFFISCALSCALLLSPLLPAGSGHSFGLNSQSQSRGPKPETGPPAPDLPNLDEVRRRRHPEPEAPVPVESAIRSHRKPLAPRNGRKVGDLLPLLGEGAANQPPTSAHTSRRVAAGSSHALRGANSKSRAAGAKSHHPAAAARTRALSPLPISDDQYVQNFFQWALVRQPHADETLYWDDMLRAAYAHGQTSMVMAVRELGKTLFESAEYAARDGGHRLDTDTGLHIPEHAYVKDLYKTYLLRDPDQGGWDFWASLVRPLGHEAVRRAFDESAEFISIDVPTITPTGSASSAVSSLAAARVDPKNRSGDQIMARDAEWGATVLSLAGRAGLDLGLGISYSSAATYTRSGPYIYYDEDNGFPSSGFRLGFPTIPEKFFDAQIGQNAYLLITSAGTRVELRQVGTSNIYEAADSSYLQLTDSASYLTLRSPDGMQLNYIKIENEWRCNQVKDRNGNYVTANYTSLGDLSNVTDTLGRLITFNYDGNANLISITQTWNGQAHTWATFSWTTTTVQPSFTSGALVGAPPLGTSIPVLWKVGLADGSYYKFTYNSSPTGQVNLFEQWAIDGIHRGYVSYDYETNTSDCPRITAAHDYADYWNGYQGVPADITTQFSIAGDGGYRMVTPDGAIYKEYYGTSWQKGLVTSTKVFANATDEATNSTQKSTTAMWTQDNTTLNYEMNPRPTETNIYDAAGNRRRSKIGYATFTLPSGASCSLPSDIYEYAANATTVLRRSHTDYRYDSAYLDRRIIGLPAMQYVCDGSQGEIPCGNSSGASLVSKVAFDYDWANFASETLRPTPQPAIQHDETNYSNSFVYGRGNLVWTAPYNLNDGSFVEHKRDYYETGTVVEDRDPLGHATTIGYTDSFSDGNNGRNTFAYPTTITDADLNSSYIKYNFDFGAVTEKQTPSPNAGPVPKQTMTYDSAGRVSQVSNSINNAYTRYVYGATYVQSYASINTVADEAYSIKFFDGAGRVYYAASNHPDSVGLYRGQTMVYDVMGRVWKQSNPTEVSSGSYPTGDDASWLYTTQTYDWKGRPLITTNTDGTTRTASYNGCGCAGGEVVTLIDEGAIDPTDNTAKKRQQKIYHDVLGRVWKTEAYKWQGGALYSSTVNTYNARDQITLVRQFQGAAPIDPNDLSCPTGPAGSICQQTSMTYDGQGRLKTKHEPEQNAGTATTYNYNLDDTLSSVVDARGATCTYNYNARHQATSVTHTLSGYSTINISYSYDTAGNRIQMNDPQGWTSYSYDQLSRLLSENRHFNSVSNPNPNSTDHNYKLTYAYNLAGEMTSITDPFDATINHGYDTAGRTASVTGSYAGVTTYANNVKYRAWGAVKSASFGNSSSETVQYNARLQPTQFRLTNGSTNLLREDYTYYNDGRLQHIADLDDTQGTHPPDTLRFMSRKYQYDYAGRVASGGGDNTVPFAQSYGYNEFDNLTSRYGSYDWQSSQLDTATFSNNRRAGWNYDPDGRLTVSPANTSSNLRNWYYDAAGQKTTVTETAGSTTTTYISAYDGDGQVIYESLSGINATTDYLVHSTVLAGEVITKLNSSGNKSITYMPGGGLVFPQQTKDYNGNPLVNWVQRDPQGVTETGLSSYDPLGNYVPFMAHPPVPQPPGPIYGPSYGWGSSGFGNANNFGTGCTLDGAPANCNSVLHAINAGDVRAIISTTGTLASLFNAGLGGLAGSFIQGYVNSNGTKALLNSGQLPKNPNGNGSYYFNDMNWYPATFFVPGSMNDSFATAEGFGIATPDPPQNPASASNPVRIKSRQRDQPCSIVVNFAPGTIDGLTRDSGLPTGPGIAQDVTKGAIYGLGFTVSAGVFDGEGIGYLGEDPNPKTPTGNWTLNQQASVKGFANGEKEEISDPHDINNGAAHYFAPQNVIYWDHPGLPAQAGNFGHFTFDITLTNGKKKCEVKFSMDVSYGGSDIGSVTWR